MIFNLWQAMLKDKGRGFPYSLPSVGPGADLNVQAVIHQVVGCYYFMPGLRLPSQPWSITALGLYQVALLGDRGT